MNIMNSNDNAVTLITKHLTIVMNCLCECGWWLALCRWLGMVCVLGGGELCVNCLCKLSVHHKK